jgi:GH25 family lysozyme M1 (1,4-beta-N-acetylmuramidase)
VVSIFTLSTSNAFGIQTPLTSIQQASLQASTIPLAGPGNLVHGVDLSIWQHKAGAINFKKMYQSGVRFLIVKGSDSIPTYDSSAYAYMRADRTAAHLNGSLTSFYHYATLPNSTDIATLTVDAMKQAQHVSDRISQLGGYSPLDLPVALDLESNCVATDSQGNCTKRLSPKLTTIWVSTFMKTLTTLTNRKPMIYAYPTFLEGNLLYNSDLAQYPLWVAQYGASPAIIQKYPGLKGFGCYLTPWTDSSCSQNWSVWQYTSCGIGSKYGIASGRLDLNVFRGTPEQFVEFAQGSWTPPSIISLPLNQATTVNIESTTATDSRRPVIIQFSVTTNNKPVLDGSVKYYNPDSIQGSGASSYARLPNGDFQLTITGLKAGTYIGEIEYQDMTGVYANTSMPVQFNITNPNPNQPLPPKVKPTPTPSGCAVQFIN